MLRQLLVVGAGALLILGLATFVDADGNGALKMDLVEGEPNDINRIEPYEDGHVAGFVACNSTGTHTMLATVHLLDAAPDTEYRILIVPSDVWGLPGRGWMTTDDKGRARLRFRLSIPVGYTDTVPVKVVVRHDPDGPWYVTSYVPAELPVK
ncbi:MAG: hypothetical protein ACYTG6_09790 [Planctomycetota bacterium]|jgi:hypothetical protein